MCGDDLNGRCIVIFYEQEHGRRWSGWSIETKKIIWPASLNKCKMIYMVLETVLCIIIENKLLMMMMIYTYNNNIAAQGLYYTLCTTICSYNTWRRLRSVFARSSCLSCWIADPGVYNQYLKMWILYSLYSLKRI